ncbi:hypothetical protein SSPO_096290 [Streptomyces antimycoticus]|uniref:Uncharacterized protein n=1 Tax=Streptomyces antimycoticus TaxID=68175 RepID=A0A499VBK3_9ACTN|nr:hypothetical protein SSPO_096290 [Streptomyces antimycoticus]
MTCVVCGATQPARGTRVSPGRTAALPVTAPLAPQAPVYALPAVRREAVPRRHRSHAVTERVQLPTLSTEKDYDGDEFLPIYTTTVTVHGGVASHGRASGQARSSDGALGPRSAHARRAGR